MNTKVINVKITPNNYFAIILISPIVISDERVEHLPFIGSPLPIVGLIIFYVYFVTEWGPKLMKDRKAFDLKGVIKIYNLIQIFANLYIGFNVSI